MSRVPRLLSRQNLASLPLTPAESHLVSQIDGSVSELDLAFITGLPPVQVAATLDRLYRLGAIDFAGNHLGGARATPPGGRPAAHTSPPPARSVPPPKASTPGGSGAPYDPAELDEPADLDVEKKRRILDLYYQLDVRTYYELLGVDEQSDKKQVKGAYYALAPEFHPDKYFRKNLGSFRAKIEAIFARLTLAHDVLANPKRRAEYDEYVTQTQRNRAVSAALEQSQRDLAMVEAAVRQAAAAVASAPAPFTTGGAPQPVRPSQPAMPAISPEEALRLRREALARKLTGGGPRPAPTPAARVTPATRPKEMDPEVAQRAAQALRARHEAAIAEAKRQQLQRYLETGRQALASQDFAGAANAYRIAASLEPDDPKVQAICNEALRQAAAALADGYWKQATYEESQERWAEAALSYAKVCAGRPEDAIAHERVAYSTLRSSSNVRRAVEFARKAVELAPKSPEFRITLARAYLAAGLEKSCFGELDRALELGAGNAKIQALAAQVRTSATSSTKDGKVS